MRAKTFDFFLWATLAMLSLFVAAAGAADRAALDAAFAALGTYQWGGADAASIQIDGLVQVCHADPALRAELERRLIGVLGSEATRAGKEYACRKLRLIGTDRAARALGRLLADPELSHMARYALEGIGTPRAADALRDALNRTEGELLAGVIGSLGALRDEKATTKLIPLLQSPSDAVVAAALAALAEIASDKAVAALADYASKAPPARRPLACDAHLAAAERLMARGRREAAQGIYRRYYDNMELPASLRVAAFSGLVCASPNEADRLILEALAGPDERLRRRAGRLAGEIGGRGATLALARGLGGLPPAGQAELLAALQYRADPAARQAVLVMLDSSDPSVRVAAIAALSTTGRADDVTRLANLAVGAAAAERETARRSLVEMRGRNVDQTMIDMLARSGLDAATRAELLAVLNARKASEAVPAALLGINDADADVRTAAALLLGHLGSEREAPALARWLCETRSAEDRARAAEALSRICARGGETCAPAILAALPGAPAEAKPALLRLLPLVAADAALETLRAHLEADETAVRDAAVDALSRWPDERALPDLLQLVRHARRDAHYVLGFRGYVRLLRARENRGRQEAELLSQLWGLARRAEEKKLVVAALGEVPTPEALEALRRHLADGEVAPEVSAAIVALAPGLARDSRPAVLQVLNAVVSANRSERDVAEARRLLKELQP
ncbi:HEAT repeat domain-containing protein [bacterium]|nr:HEAT repeat domain-containing protein [bacterium]